MAKTVYKKTKAIARNAAVSGKPGGMKISKTKITGTPVKRKKQMKSY
jgi:hypothetical protein